MRGICRTLWGKIHGSKLLHGQQRLAIGGELVIYGCEHDCCQGVVTEGFDDFHGALASEELDGLGEDGGADVMLAEDFAAHLDYYAVFFV